jgi:hypothetical protein
MPAARVYFSLPGCLLSVRLRADVYKRAHGARRGGCDVAGVKSVGQLAFTRIPFARISLVR